MPPLAQSQYATPAELARLSLTSAALQRFGGESSPIVLAMLQAASSECDAYFPSQWKLPLVSWDMNLRRVTCNIAAYLLYSQFGYNTAAPGDQMVVRRYEQAIAWLIQIRDKIIFPPYVDITGIDPQTLEQGDYAVSDGSVGFTATGRTSRGFCARPLDPWSFVDCC